MTKNTLKIVNTEKTEDKKEKQKALDAAISQIDQNYGKGSVMRLGQSRVLDIESISTGSLGLDLALGIGGLPKSRIVEIYGPESSGKLLYHYRLLLRPKKKVEFVHSLMRSMLLTQFMQKN